MDLHALHKRWCALLLVLCALFAGTAASAANLFDDWTGANPTAGAPPSWSFLGDGGPPGSPLSLLAQTGTNTFGDYPGPAVRKQSDHIDVSPSFYYGLYVRWTVPGPSVLTVSGSLEESVKIDMHFALLINGVPKELVPGSGIVEYSIDGHTPGNPFKFTYTEPTVFAAGSTVDFWFRSQACCGTSVYSTLEVLAAPVPEPSEFLYMLFGLPAVLAFLRLRNTRS